MNQTKSPALAGKPGLEKQTSQDYTAPTASCAKAAAVALYSFNVLPRERVAVMFARNPSWRAA